MSHVSQDAEFDAVFEMAQKLAKRTHTEFVVDPVKRESFVVFGEIVAAYSCADTLGVWGDPGKEFAKSVNAPPADPTSAQRA